MRVSRGIGAVLAFAALALPAASAFAEPPLFTQSRVRVGAPLAGAPARYVHVDRGLLAGGDELRLQLSDDVEVTARDVHTQERANGILSWSSALEVDRFGSALFVQRGDAVLGRIVHEGRAWEVRPFAGDLHEIRELDVDALPPDSEPLEIEVEAPQAFARSLPGLPRDAIDAIRVLVVYTPEAEAASADIELEAQLAVDATNQAYANSDMATRLELVATVETPYDEAGDVYADLDALRSRTDGAMDEVHALRNAWLADFVALLTGVNPSYCGVASLMQTVSADFEDHAFSVTYVPCAVGNLTLAHEIGHNMGCQHDRANATSLPAYSWAYGFQDPEGDFRTVMATAAGCEGACPRVAHFANPDVLYLAQPTGVDAAEADSAACALAIDATSPVTTDFRALVAPGSLEASTTKTDRVEVTFGHPWPWSFQVYRSEGGAPMVPVGVTDTLAFDDTTAVPGTSYDYWVSTRTAADGESSATGPVTGVRAIPVCGNSIPEPPAEGCDDGNAVAGDGCAPDCQLETPIDEAAAECVKAVNDRAVRVSKTQGKENLVCLAASSSGAEADADACLEADAKQKVAKAGEKAVAVGASRCPSVPPYGYAGVLVAVDAAVNERRESMRDLFGEDVSAAVIAKSVDAEGAACQKLVAKAADKLHATTLAAFLACKKDLLRALAVSSPESLEACFDDVAQQAEAGGSRIQAMLGKLSTARLKKCAAVDLAAAFPGACGATIGTTFDGCVLSRTLCRTCRFFNRADALARDCDLFDDAASNASCEP